LATADGVMRWHDERQIGYTSGTGLVVPIVSAAILFDLLVGKGTRPTADMGYQACENATDEPVEQGCVGAGTGARIGAMLGNERASKGGIGSAAIELDNGLVIAALMAVNAVGDVIDENGDILAGVRTESDDGFMGMLNVMTDLLPAGLPLNERENTVIGVVATNAKLTKSHTHKVSQMAHDGIARAVNPSHTMFDGDTIFALATGDVPANVTVVGAYAAEVVAQAIRNGVRQATSLGGVRAIRDML
jgi:L-aminopeptidase/D-esterase-like protein